MYALTLSSIDSLTEIILTNAILLSCIRAKARLGLPLCPQPEGWGYDRVFASIKRLVSVQRADLSGVVLL